MDALLEEFTLSSKGLNIGEICRSIKKDMNTYYEVQYPSISGSLLHDWK